MKILLTGANGQLGREICRSRLPSGVKLVPTSRAQLDLTRPQNIAGFVHEAEPDLIINAAAYTHTSVAILDALMTLAVPIVEVHITNIHARERFRQRSYVSKVARAVICGFGIDGYALAVAGLAALVGAEAGAKASVKTGVRS
jgi:3-dehydroquinate dehydratase